jgi:hypothetical protein
MSETSIRIENLLLLSPFVFLFLFISLMPNQPVPIILMDVTFMLSQVEATIVCFVLAAVPYLFHYMLRKTNNGNIFLLDIHVAVSFLLICFLPIAYYQVPLISVHWEKDQFPMPVYEKWESTMRIVTFLWASYLIVQVVFIAYTVFTFARKKIHV